MENMRQFHERFKNLYVGGTDTPVSPFTWYTETPNFSGLEVSILIRALDLFINSKASKKEKREAKNLKKRFEQ